MPTEVVCAIIAAVGAVLSALIAWFVSKSTVNGEIIKMQLKWEHEHSVSSEEEFSEMVSAVTRHIHAPCEESFLTAVEKINTVRLKETGELFYSLCTLYECLTLRWNDSRFYSDFVEKYLAKVIDQKRKSLCQGQTNDYEQPSL